MAPSPPSHARLKTTVPQPAPFTTTLQKQRRHSRLALPCVTLASLAICQAKQNPRVEVSKLDPDSRESVPASASVRHVLSVALDIAAEPHSALESRALSHLVNLQGLDFVHIALLRSPAARHNVKSNARSTFWADETRHADTRTSPAQRRVVQGARRALHSRHQVICPARSDKDISTCTSIFQTCRTLQQRVHHDRVCRITITFSNTSFPNLHWRPRKLTSIQASPVAATVHLPHATSAHLTLRRASCQRAGTADHQHKPTKWSFSNTRLLISWSLQFWTKVVRL